MGTLVMLFVSGGWLLFTYPYAVARGLRPRTHRTFTVRIRGERLVLVEGTDRRVVAIADIAAARFATNANWTESTLVDDALTLYGVGGRRLASIPASAASFAALRALLTARRIPVEVRDVAGPAYLD